MPSSGLTDTTNNKKENVKQAKGLGERDKRGGK